MQHVVQAMHYAMQTTMHNRTGLSKNRVMVKQVASTSVGPQCVAQIDKSHADRHHPACHPCPVLNSNKRVMHFSRPSNQGKAAHPKSSDVCTKSSTLMHAAKGPLSASTNQPTNNEANILRVRRTYQLAA
jgi:hypothetical protein